MGLFEFGDFRVNFNHATIEPALSSGQSVPLADELFAAKQGFEVDFTFKDELFSQFTLAAQV
jgi:hypothetical protein